MYVLGGKGSVWRSSAVSQEGRWTDGGDQGILFADQGFLLMIKVSFLLVMQVCF